MEQDHNEYFQKYCDIRHYTPETDYWERINDAELYGSKILTKEIDKCFKDAKESKFKSTELALVLWLKYELYDKADDDIYMNLFYEKYSEVDSWACEHLDENDIIYYMRTVR